MMLFIAFPAVAFQQFPSRAGSSIIWPISRLEKSGNYPAFGSL